MAVENMVQSPADLPQRHAIDLGSVSRSDASVRRKARVFLRRRQSSYGGSSSADKQQPCSRLIQHSLLLNNSYQTC